MRKASGMKLSNRLVAFVTVVVFTAILVLFVGGSLSFRHLADGATKHYLHNIVSVVDEELAKPDGVRNLTDWLPKTLRAVGVIELDIQNASGSIFHYEQIKYVSSVSERTRLDIPLMKNPGLTVTIVSLPGLSMATYSIGALSTTTLAIGVIALGLMFGIRWLRRQLHGSEILETRGRMILAGRLEQYSQGSEEEWPATASLALDQVIEELNHARQERSRFDTFIRTHTFLDQLTGAANRVLFDSRLNALLKESENNGAVVLIRIADFDELRNEVGDNAADEFVRDVASVINNFSQRFPDGVFARYYRAEFGLLIPNPAEAEVGAFINQMLKALERLMPPEPLQEDDWCHIGVSYFGVGESPIRIMEEADMALKSAELQGTNSWFAFRKEKSLSQGKGSVRWRTLFERIFENDGPIIYLQKVNSDSAILHHEMLARIRDENGVMVKANRFVPVMKEVGFITRLDRFMFSRAVTFLAENDSSISVNISVTSLTNKDFFRWLSHTLLQLERTTLCRLAIEVSEASAVNSLDALKPVAKLIGGVGASLIVDHAGRSIVSMHYIKELKPHYIKLHRSLVKDIEQRPENQLFIRSMLGSCADTRTQVIAVGVENEREWISIKSLGINLAQGRLFGTEIKV